MKNNFYVLDTSFICSLINRSDDNYILALTIFESLSNNSQFFIPQTVNLELTIFLAKNPEFKPSIDKLYLLITPEFINIDDLFLIQFKRFCAKTKFNLKPIDYSILFCCKLNNFNLLSFDKKLIVTLNK